MARIISYPVLSTVSSGDWIPITDTSVAGNPLKNVTVGDLQSFIIQGSTLQTVITAGNTYQGPQGPLWEWNNRRLTATSSTDTASFSNTGFQATNLIDNAYTLIKPASLAMVIPNGRGTTLIPNLSLVSNVTLQMPLASGVLALTTDIPASPWVPVTGGINYSGGRVGINTPLPQEELDVTGDVTVTGRLSVSAGMNGELNGTISSSTTGTTQASNDDSDKVATTAFVNNAVEAIPAGLTFKGNWDALNNTPTLSLISTQNNGDFYIVSVAGNTNLSGITDWEVGDWAIAVISGNVLVWQKIDNSSVLTGSGTGSKIAKWDGLGTSVTLTDSAIAEGNGSVAINSTIDLETALYVEGLLPSNIPDTYNIKSKAKNANTDASIVASVFGITSDATSAQTVGSAGNIQGIRANARHEGASDVTFVVGSNAIAKIANGGGVNSSIYGSFATANTDGTLTSQNKWHIGSFVNSMMGNTNHTARDLIGAYINTSPSEGTAQDMTVLWVNNSGVGGGAFNLTGDLTYLKITQGIMAGVGGTARAIHSEVTLPSLLLGSLESTGFIKTGGAATEFLMADGTVTTGAFTGNIPDGQITFGNASSNGITSSANLEFDDAFKVLTVKGTSVGQTIVRDDNVLVAKDASTRIGIGISTIPRVQLSQGNVNTYLQLIGTPTQENTIALPDKSGTVALLDDVVGSVTGTGNVGYVPLWSSTTALTDSAIFQNISNGRIGIGTQTPFAQLETTEDILIADQVYIGTGDGPAQQNLRFGAGTLVSNVTGVFNIAIGQSALGLATGDQNTAVGALALLATTTGQKNTGIGAGALYDNQSGNQNVAVGPQSLYNNVLGSRNIAMGFEALYANNSSDNTAIGYQTLRGASNNMNNNVAIGNEAGRSGNATFYNNTLIGQQAALHATTANGAVVIGRQTGRIAADGTGNVTNLTRSVIIGAFASPLTNTSLDEIVIGYDAEGLGNNTAVIGSTATQKTRLHGNVGIGVDAPAYQLQTSEGINVQGMNIKAPVGSGVNQTNNTAVGFNAMELNTTGDHNTGIGGQALLSNTTGENNTALGSSALTFNDVGNRNVAVGRRALVLNAIGSDNVALGYNALYNSNGNGSVAIGSEAMEFTTTGQANTAVGTQALQLNTTGELNTSVGKSAGRSNTTGSSNTTLGFQAGYSITTASSNTYIGKGAGDLNLGSNNSAVGADALGSLSSGGGNVALGYKAGAEISGGTPNTTSTDSVFIGKDASPLALSQTNEIVIGADAVGTGSNTTVIGNQNTTDTRVWGKLDVPTGGIDSFGDIEIDLGQGVILKSPNGTRYRIVVSDLGALSATLVVP